MMAKNLKQLTLFILSTWLLILLQGCEKDQSISHLKKASSKASCRGCTTTPILQNVAIIGHDSCVFWYPVGPFQTSSTGLFSIGTFTNSTAYQGLTSYQIPTNNIPNLTSYTLNQLYIPIGVGIDNLKRCFFWYQNGTFSIGSYANATAYRSLWNYYPTNSTYTSATSTKKTIVRIALTKLEDIHQYIGNPDPQNRDYQDFIPTYTWYSDYTVGMGIPNTLDFISKEANKGTYKIPIGESQAKIVGIGVADQNYLGRVYVWYSDGFLSIGDRNNFGLYGSNIPYK